MLVRSSQRRRSSSSGSSRSVGCRSRDGEADPRRFVSSGLPQDQEPHGGKGVDTGRDGEIDVATEHPRSHPPWHLAHPSSCRHPLTLQVSTPRGLIVLYTSVIIHVGYMFKIKRSVQRSPWDEPFLHGCLGPVSPVRAIARRIGSLLVQPGLVSIALSCHASAQSLETKVCFCTLRDTRGKCIDNA